MFPDRALATITKLFGDIAIERGFCTREQIEEAVAAQAAAVARGEPKQPMGAVLVELGYLSLIQINSITEAVENAKRRRSIEGFDILAKLGTGGMSSVYLARQISLNKNVALKVLPKKLAHDVEALARFKREALATAKLNHPGIVQAYDVGESNGFHYLVMEYIQGETLKDLLEREKRLDEKHVIDLALKVADALAHASEHRIVHRDVKPANIMLTRGGDPKLCDLGLAISKREDNTLTRAGIIMGTPYYLSPEQARGEAVDERTDIYSLGATLYHAVTGTVPFEGETTAVILTKHINDTLPDPRTRRPEVSPGFSAVLKRMMAKEPANRFRSVEELIADLDSLKRTGVLPANSMTGAALGQSGKVKPPSSDERVGGPRAGSIRISRRVGRRNALAAAFAGIALGFALMLLVGGEDAVRLAEARVRRIFGGSAEAQQRLLDPVFTQISPLVAAGRIVEAAGEAQVAARDPQNAIAREALERLGDDLVAIESARRGPGAKLAAARGVDVDALEAKEWLLSPRLRGIYLLLRGRSGEALIALHAAAGAGEDVRVYLAKVSPPK
jgi:serine/threonine-protein kinase